MVRKFALSKLGLSVELIFQITQHSRDVLLMNNLVEFLGCGKCYPRAGKDFVEFRVGRILDNTEKIIPFFDKYPLMGVKRLDYLD